MVFADASALVKRYVRERHGAVVRGLLAAEPVAVSRLSEVEVPSAFARLAREGRLSERRRERAVAAFVEDFGAWHVVELTTVVTSLARGLLERYDLRAGDAIQLASVLWLRQALPDTLSGALAFDVRLSTALAAERLLLPMSPRRAVPLAAPPTRLTRAARRAGRRLRRVAEFDVG